MTDAPIRLVLDASAITKYAAGNEHLGELITIMTEEDARFGIPTACLADAVGRLAPDVLPMLELLVGHPQATVVEGWPGKWRDVGEHVRVCGSLSRAVAVLWALRLEDAYLVTAERAAYGPDDDDLFLEV